MRNISKKSLIRVFALAVLAVAIALIFVQQAEKSDLTALLLTCRAVEEDPEKAVAACSKIIAMPAFTDAERADRYRFRGRALGRLGDWSAALQDFERSVQLTPESFAAWYWKSWALRGAGEYEAALEAIETSLKLAPSYQHSLHAQIEILRNLGRADEAEARLVELMAEYPDEVWIPKNLGLIWLTAKQYQRASDVFRIALDIDFWDSELLNGFISACIGLGDDCAPLHPDARMLGQEPSCEDTLAEFLEMFPHLKELNEESYGPDAEDLYDKSKGFLVVGMYYPVLVMNLLNEPSIESARQMITIDRARACTEDGYSSGDEFDPELYARFQKYLGGEVARNHRDIANEVLRRSGGRSGD